MNGADIIAEIIKREGTDFLAVYPRNDLIDACARIDVRPVLCRQERVGVGMADGYSRIRRGKQNGVFAAQHGPGIENAFPGVAQAYAENVPLLVIPGGFPGPRQAVRPTFRSAEVYRPVTKHAEMVHTVASIPTVMRRAYQALRTGKGGPVLVEVPNNIFAAEFEGELDYTPVPVLRAAPDPDAVKRAAKMLLAAQHPVLWAGQGVHYAEASDQLAALAELVPAPVACTNPGKSAIADSHPLSLGGSTRSQSKGYAHFMARADLVLALGSSLTRTSFGPGIPAGKTIIHSTNEPSDINKDYVVDLGLVGDAGLVLDALIEDVGRQKTAGAGDNAGLAALTDEIAAVKAEWLEEWAEHLNSEEVPINQYRVLNELMRLVDRDNAIVTHDSGSPREQTMPFWQTTKAGSYMGWGKSTQLGYGLGIIMGAKLAAPEKFCMNIMGDCSFGMTGMDIETASRNGIAITTVVFNNAVMACERAVMEVSTEKYGSLSVGGNYAKLADALNVGATRVESPAEIEGAIKSALDANAFGKPYLVEIMAKEGYDFSRYQTHTS